MSPSSVAADVFRVTANRDAWLSTLGAASRVATNKVIPVLGSALIRISKGAATWWATDGEMWRGGTLGAESLLDGEGLLPVAQALALIKALPDSPVAITFDAHDAIITAKRFTAKVPTVSVLEFPQVPDVPAGGARWPAASLLPMLAQAVVSIDPTHPQYRLRGALLTIGGGHLSCVSTDGHRIAWGQVRADADFESAQVLPVSTLRELSAMSQGAEVIRHVVDEDDRHFFACGDQVLSSRVIDGQFPNVLRVVPTSYACQATCDRAALSSVLKRAGLALSKDKIGIVVTVAESSIAVRGASVEKGEAADVIDADVSGDPLVLHINPAYVRELLDACEDERVVLQIKSPLDPLVIRPVGRESDALFAVAMMRP